MANIYKGTLGLIGNTPLVEVTNVEKELGLEATLLVKLEYFNPAGSVKDRIAKAMIEDAEAKGILKEGSVIIEPTSGNTSQGYSQQPCRPRPCRNDTFPLGAFLSIRSIVSSRGSPRFSQPKANSRVVSVIKN